MKKGRKDNSNAGMYADYINQTVMIVLYSTRLDAEGDEYHIDMRGVILNADEEFVKLRDATTRHELLIKRDEIMLVEHIPSPIIPPGVGPDSRPNNVPTEKFTYLDVKIEHRDSGKDGDEE